MIVMIVDSYICMESSLYSKEETGEPRETHQPSTGKLAILVDKERERGEDTRLTFKLIQLKIKLQLHG